MSLILLAVLFLSLNVNATEWMELQTLENEIMYFDFDSLRTSKRSGVIRAWLMLDYPEAKGKSTNKFHSIKVLVEISCKREEIRTIYGVSYSENMGKGNPIFTSDEKEKWTPAIPEDNSVTIYKTLCKKNLLAGK
jgi:hypothetical protein